LKKKKHTLLFVLTDYCVATIVWIIFFFVRKQILGENSQESFPIKSLIGGGVVGGFWIMLYSLGDSYVNFYRYSRIAEVSKTFLVTLVGTVIIFFVLLIDDTGVQDYRSYYNTSGTYFIIHFFAAATAKLILLTYFKRLLAKGSIYFKTIIIGGNHNAKNLYHELLHINHTLGNKFIGFIKSKERQEDLLSEFLPTLGTLAQVDHIIQKYGIEQVIIALDSDEKAMIENILTKLHGLNVRIQVTPSHYQMLTGNVKVQHIFAVPLVEVKHSVLNTWQQIIKRSFDMVVSLFVLIVGLPFFIIISIITKLSSAGPVFFLQERIGKNGKPFHIIKFRSMYLDAEKGTPELSSQNDPRVTKWGKFMRRTRLDESPQFLNVLKGDMAIVGPRPERRYYIDQIIKQEPHYNHLLSVRPGITSLGQVKYGYAQNLEEMQRRMKYDIIYIENMSIIMDMRILFFTIPVILKGRGK